MSAGSESKPKYEGKFYERDDGAILCSKCHANAHVEYSEFPCKDDFIITRLVCRIGGCGARWRLVIEPTPPGRFVN